MLNSTFWSMEMKGAIPLLCSTKSYGTPELLICKPSFLDFIQLIIFRIIFFNGTSYPRCYRPDLGHLSPSFPKLMHFCHASLTLEAPAPQIADDENWPLYLRWFGLLKRQPPETKPMQEHWRGCQNVKVGFGTRGTQSLLPLVVQRHTLDPRTTRAFDDKRVLCRWFQVPIADPW